MPIVPLPKGSRRDRRLDFWRGICLIDMVLVHLVYADVQFGYRFGLVLTDYVRFAAGGFVFLSGLCVGRIFLPKVLKAKTRDEATAVYHRLIRRGVKLLGVAYCVTIAMVGLDLARGSGDYVFGWALLRDIVSLKLSNDLLLLYAIMLAVTPGVIELLRRGLWPVVAVGSIAVFALGGRHPWWLTSRGPSVVFPPMLWQMVFISGLLFGRVLEAFDTARAATRWAVMAGILGVFGVLFQSKHAEALHLGRPLLAVKFWKVPLTIGEYGYYLCLTLLIVLGTNLAWPKLRDGRVTAFVGLLGRNSLLVYVAHLFVQEGVTTIAYRTSGLGAWQMLYGVAMILVLAGIAWVAEWWSATPRAGQPSAGPEKRRVVSSPRPEASPFSRLACEPRLTA